MGEGPLDRSLAGIAAAVHRGDVSPSELVSAALERVAAVNGAVNALVAVDARGAYAAAAEVERRVLDGDLPPLAGVPFVVKETESVRGWRSTAGDPARSAAPPAPRDSIQVARLRAAGAVPLGAANCALYGGWAETTNPLFGTTVNPWDPARIPGGSSGGSAAAVAARMVPLATGSDGGGSIRIPASACGVVGLKPTTGVVPLGDDTAPPSWGDLVVRGPLTRSVTDLATALDVVAGPDPRDPASVGLGGPSFSAAALEATVAELRVAWSPTLGYARVDGRVLAVCEGAVGLLERGGARVGRVDDLIDADPLSAFSVPFLLAMATEVQRARGGSSAAGLGAEMAGWLARAASVSAADVAAAALARRQLTARCEDLFGRWDVLVCPTVAGLPPPAPHPATDWVQLTHPFNMTGMPALSLPAGTVTVAGVDLPVGIQVVAPRLCDKRVLAVAAWLEASLGLQLRPPIHATG